MRDWFCEKGVEVKSLWTIEKPLSSPPAFVAEQPLGLFQFGVYLEKRFGTCIEKNESQGIIFPA
jgi:hypothetical protein